MMRSSFSVHSVTDNIVFIIDLDTGMSVTNDAESVCQYLNDNYPKKRIVYRDTEGQWDELVHVNGRFTGFLPGFPPRIS